MDKNKRTITIVANDPEDQLEGLLTFIQERANPGHSFTVSGDADSDEGEGTFSFDGDGAFSIEDITVEKEEEPEEEVAEETKDEEFDKDAHKALILAKQLIDGILEKGE